MSTSTDILLASKFKDGDKQAFEIVFKDNYKQLRLAAFILLDDEFEAEDIVQQTFIDIWNKGLYKTIDISIKAYLQKAVRNKCLNMLNKKKVQKRAAADYVYNESQAVYADDLQETETLSPLVKKSLDNFPQQRQVAFDLVYLKNKTYKEAASQMGITVNSVKTHLKIGMRQLRSILQTADTAHQ